MTTLELPNVLFHTASERALKAASTNHRHSYLIRGAEGSGKLQAAKWLAGSIVGDKWNNQCLYINPDDKGSISIHKIKDIRNYTQYKSSGPEDRRAVIISNCHSMTIEAQNSFLKILEEPSEDVLFILLSSESGKLLETINSRLQEINLKPVSFKQVQGKYPEENIETLKKLFLMSGGAGELIDELVNDREHRYRDQISDGKRLIGSSPYERLASLSDYASDKDKLNKTLSASIQIMTAALRSSAKSGKSIKPHLERIDALLKAQKGIQKNHNTKLVLTLLFCSL